MEGCSGGEDMGHHPLRKPKPLHPLPRPLGDGASGYRNPLLLFVVFSMHSMTKIFNQGKTRFYEPLWLIIILGGSITYFLAHFDKIGHTNIFKFSRFGF